VSSPRMRFKTSTYPAQTFAIERRASGDQLIEHRTERVDVAAGIDVIPAGVGPIERAHHGAERGERGGIGLLPGERLGEAEFDYLGSRLALLLGHNSGTRRSNLFYFVGDPFFENALEGQHFLAQPAMEFVPFTGRRRSAVTTCRDEWISRSEAARLCKMGPHGVLRRIKAPTASSVAAAESKAVPGNST